MNDAKVKRLAGIMDLTLTELLTVCENNPMILIGILGARLKFLSVRLDCEDEFVKLLRFIIRDHENNEITDMTEANEVLGRIARRNK